MGNVLNVKPTKMERRNLKHSLTIAKRGHKLLKDKQDELIRQFIVLVKENRALRNEVEAELTIAMQNFSLASAMINERFLDEVVSSSADFISLNVVKENIMSVEIPKMAFDYDEEKQNHAMDYYSYLNTNADLDVAMAHLSHILPKLLKLTEIEKTCQLLADEIEKTRRRVNALEYRMIPNTETTIKYINAKLEENERSTKIRMMKVKDMGDREV